MQICALRGLVTPICWALTGRIWLYNIGWMFVLGAARVAKSIALVTHALRPAANLR